MAARYSVERVMSAWKFSVDNVEGNKLYLSKKTYNMSPHLPMYYNKGTACKVCGREGVAFEEYKSGGKRHLRLIAEDPSIHFTIDHTIPRCIGGSNMSSNKEPLCSICNNHWKSAFDNLLKKKVIGISASCKDEYLIIIE